MNLNRSSTEFFIQLSPQDGRGSDLILTGVHSLPEVRRHNSAKLTKMTWA